MKAAVLYELGKPLVVEDGIETPPLNRGQVLVRLFYSGVCHSQIMEARGNRGVDPYLPHLLGHEATGEVVDVGAGVAKVKPGDRVVLGWVKGDGIEAGGAKYRSKTGRVINSGGVTTFSDLSVVSENRCVPLPPGVPADIGVLFGCAVPTGAGIVLNSLRPRAGATLAVIGLGGIGLCALAATRVFEPDQVIAIDIEPAKLELAMQLGATHVIDASNQDVVEAVRELTSGRGVDYSIEAAGSSKTIELAFEILRRGGKCIFASHPKAGSTIQLDPFELICGKQIEGSWGGASKPDIDVPKFADLYRRKQLPLEKLITKRYTLDEINDALDDLETGRVGRPIIEIDPNF